MNDKARTELTPERLREVLSYDPETGVFTWKVRSSNRISIGDAASCKNDAGYILIRIDGQLHRAHRLAWLYVHGVWPESEIDHRNGVRSDNWISNLREATRKQNAQNLGLTSKHPGVYWATDKELWRVRIMTNGRRVHVGYFEDLGAAIEARGKAKERHHEFNPFDRAVSV
jgi:hypothetical protein